MSSYAELLQTCTEFQENFSVLSGKYSALSHEWENERDRSAQLRRKLEEALVREERGEEQLRTLRRDLEEASGYKDKLSAAAVEVEQLKNRMQLVRRGAADAAAEHEQEVEQLKKQVSDLLQRIDIAADGSRVGELNKQVVELESRAASANAALRQEKESFSQQLLVAHNALREQQARNLELEQRYRAMEGEVTEMRAAVRRSAELQNDAAMLKERHATEAALAQREVGNLRQELQQVRTRLAEQRQQHEEELADVRRNTSEERAAARGRVAALTASLATATAATETEHRRYAELLRCTQQRIDEARDEAAAEVTALRQAVTEAKEEAQRARHRGDSLRDELDAARRSAQQQQAANEALQAQLDTSARQLAAGAQQEAWLTAERTHAGEQLAAAEQRVEELTTALQQREHVAMELERVRMRADMLEAELQDARRVAREAEGRLQDMEEAAAQRLQTLRQEMKTYRKQVTLERETSRALRKRLVQAISEQEADLYRTGRSGESMQPASSGAAHSGGDAAMDSASCDVIHLLKRQSEEAERLHARVVALSH